MECSLISGALNHKNNFIIIHVKLASTRCSFCSKIKSYLHSDLSLNSLSDGTEVPGMHKYFLASCCNLE